MKNNNFAFLLIASIAFLFILGCNPDDMKKLDEIFKKEMPKPQRIITINSIVKYPRAKKLEKEITTFSGQKVWVNTNSYLQSEDPKKDINIYINSPGGSVSAGMAIYDTMQILSCDINTYCIGQAASMGALLLAAGTAKKRFALPNSRIMIHQPLGGAEGQATDIAIHAKEILRIKENLNNILSKHTGQKITKVIKDTERDYFMSAEDAMKYGIVDEVLTSIKK